MLCIAHEVRQKREKFFVYKPSNFSLFLLSYTPDQTNQLPHNKTLIQPKVL